MNEKFLLSLNIDIFNADVTERMKNGCVVAVGGFDGVHLGHRALLSELVLESKRLSLPAVVFTFDLDDSPKTKSCLLSRPEQLPSLLAPIGVEAVVSAPFSAIKDMSASDFVMKYLYEGLGAKSIVCGYDFRFGKDRAGDAELIRELLKNKDVAVVTPDVFLMDGAPVSSTSIRNLISSGDIVKANRLLGREFQFVGPICHGAQLGRTLGFPTINQVFPASMVKPPYGVYAVKVSFEGKIYGGVANFGTKPTVSKDGTPVCETHIFDYSGDCYGKVARIFFLEFIRAEQRFSSVEELKEQVEKDKISAKEILAKGE